MQSNYCITKEMLAGGIIRYNSNAETFFVTNPTILSTSHLIAYYYMM